MKTPEEYINPIRPSIFCKSTVEEMISQVQIDAWNAALEWAAQNARTSVVYFFDGNEGHYRKTVSKQSILDGKINDKCK